jgi:uncharacterized Zn-binding protein involved in type VI secretion
VRCFAEERGASLVEHALRALNTLSTGKEGARVAVRSGSSGDHARAYREVMPAGPALRVGDAALCGLVDGTTPHVGGPITPAAGVATVLIGGMPAAVANLAPGGIACASPAPNGIAQGSLTVLIGGFPAARIGDLTMHGNPIAPGPGAPTVIIGG